MEDAQLILQLGNYPGLCHLSAAQNSTFDHLGLQNFDQEKFK